MNPHLVLVVNSGSSSLKYRLLNPGTGQTHAQGLIERIGEPGGATPDHAAALTIALDEMTSGPAGLDPTNLFAVGHRVVHGGSRFTGATLIDEAVRAAIADLAPLAPLHNPANLLGIDATTALFPEVPQVAVFDTAFHQTLPPAAYTYAVPRAWRTDLAVRRYGFHGTSVAYVSRRAAVLLGRAPEDTNLVVLHLGNGCSATAVEAGCSVDTSMGLSPLEGLVMGTRSGDVDPSLGAYLARAGGLDAGSYDRALNRESGLLALAGVSDFRTVSDRAAAGDPDARLALDVVVHRLVKYIGAYAVGLGRVDALVFTGGIGEHNPDLRADLLGALALLGAEVDPVANTTGSGERRVSSTGSGLTAYVIPTDEELEIATQSAQVVAGM